MPHSDEKRDRVARALNLEAGRQRGLTTEDDWDDITEQERGAWRLMASAALAVADAPSSAPYGDGGDAGEPRETCDITAFVEGEAGEPTVVSDALLDEPIDPAMFDGETFTLRDLITDHTNLWLKTIVVDPPVPSSYGDGEGATAEEVLREVRRYAYRAARSGCSPASGYADVREAVFALAARRPMPEFKPRADEVFGRRFVGPGEPCADCAGSGSVEVATQPGPAAEACETCNGSGRGPDPAETPDASADTEEGR